MIFFFARLYILAAMENSNMSCNEAGMAKRCAVGIIGAEQQEVNLLHERMEDAEFVAFAGIDFWCGKLSGVAVVVARCGIGLVNASMCTQIMIDRFGVSRIINSGVAGCTDEDLDIFDMIACTDTATHDLDITKFGFEMGQLPGWESPFFHADAKMRATALKVFSEFDKDFYRALEEEADKAPSPDSKGNSINLGFFTLLSRLPVMKEGRVVSGDSFICDDGVRNRIISTFSPSCVEMEGSAVGQTASANGIPFLILRSISDMAGKGASNSYENYSEIASRISAAVVFGMMERSSEWL